MKTNLSSKHLSWLLRHGAARAGLSVDPAGWVPVAETLAYLDVSLATLTHEVDRDNKQRFELKKGNIRAAQGHSTDDMPVTCEALESSWIPYSAAESVWHGTHPKAIYGIALDGIHAAQRTHVHLAKSLNSHVGKRSNVGVMIEVSIERMKAAGLSLFESPNGVILTRHVPVDCFIGIRALSKRARREVAQMRSALRLPPTSKTNTENPMHS